MKKKKSWIEFLLAPRKPNRILDAWFVVPAKEKPDSSGVAQVAPLGEIKFVGGWRRFAFFPYGNTLYEQDCLRDIADFCEARTKAWRQGKQKA